MFKIILQYTKMIEFIYMHTFILKFIKYQKIWNHFFFYFEYLKSYQNTCIVIKSEIYRNILNYVSLKIYAINEYRKYIEFENISNR